MHNTSIRTKIFWLNTFQNGGSTFTGTVAQLLPVWWLKVVRIRGSVDDGIFILYDDVYDDREEDTRPGGEDWEPGKTAEHLSLAAFQRELEEKNIKLSTAKIRKILITGGCWTTKRSREVAELYKTYGSISRVAEELGVSTALVTMYLPYEKAVYDLEKRSGNAKRQQRWREKNNKNIRD